MRSIAEITGNNNLLLLEYHGEVKRPYTSFYVPKQRRENREIAIRKVQNFLSHHGINKEISEDLFKLKRVQVDKQGSIWFFPEKGHSQVVEFIREEGKYQRREHGDGAGFFINSYKKGKNVAVYTDFLDFLQGMSGQSFGGKNSKDHLVLMGPQKMSLHIFLAKNENIKGLKIVESKNKEVQKNQWSFIKDLKQNLKDYEIGVESTSEEKALDRGKGIDFSF